ncbi:uncharacterized protein LOC131328472 [Rhododendron vialii]|uniref:uncharacterized protein LOC131328472 n=1 Tax=Rhododendron vialii TaxID=182163 RepID=UPI00265FABC2|nr:uncharacterized protein LOC131328472 [Rhododendron vialii]
MSPKKGTQSGRGDGLGKPPRPGFERQLKDLGVLPFTSHIINTTAESNVHLPKFTKFDPTTCEAYTHLIHFRQTIEQCTTKDKIKCKAFPSSLGSFGLQWFNKLLAGSIWNLVDLERAFNTHFTTSNKIAKEPESLSQMRKLPSETLRHKILDELAIRSPHGMGELMRIVEQFCALEEFYADRAAQGIPNPTTLLPTITSPLPAPIITQQSQQKKHVNNIREGKKCLSKVHDYVAETTYFKEPIWSFLKGIMRQPWFEWPKGKLGTDTERLAAQGHLYQYIDRTKTPTRQPAGNPNPNEPRPTIHVVHGHVTKESETRLRADLDRTSTSKQVLAVGPGSKRPRPEELPKWTITFTECDLELVQTPHSDALVLTVQIGVHDVKRVLIDQGSSAEVMYYDLLKKLDLLESALQHAEVPLIGFNGAPVWPLGQIFLPVTVGLKTLSIEFIVINVPSPYNAILDRTWLHGMQAIASTYHQVVRFIGANGR